MGIVCAIPTVSAKQAGKEDTVVWLPGRQTVDIKSLLANYY
jgi:hypothetical protein